MFDDFAALDLLDDLLRMKNNRQPTIILKALSIDTQDISKTRSVLTELRDKSEPNKKIIVAISQKSLNQFFHEVNLKPVLFSKSKIVFSCLGSTIRHREHVLPSLDCRTGMHWSPFVTISVQYHCIRRTWHNWIGHISSRVVSNWPVCKWCRITSSNPTESVDDAWSDLSSAIIEFLSDGTSLDERCTGHG